MDSSGAYPIFESKFLNGVVLSFKKRSKSIKHNVRSFHLQKIIEKTDNQSHEKLETEIVLLRKATVSFFLWDDRWSWVDVRESRQKKWIFSWQTEGRIGPTHPKVIVAAVQNTFLSAVNHNEIELDKIWNTIILAGSK